MTLFDPEMFEPEMTTIIPKKLFLGNIYNSENQELLDHVGVSAVLNVCNSAPRVTLNRTYHWCAMNDGPGNTDAQFAQAISMLDELVQHGEIVLVHCQAGVSRSSTVVATWLAKHYFADGMSFDTAADLVKKMRPIIMPHYELRKLARRFLGEISDEFPY